MAREKTISNGKCSLCGGVFDKAVMGRHVKACKQKMLASGVNKAGKTAFHLLVEGRYQPEYWMHLEVPAGATLDTLDRFLRDTWLECCGHMSEFEIGGVRYSVEPMDMDDEFMDAKLSEVLSPGVKLDHVYDFGSSTHLRLKVISEDHSDLTSRKIRLLARNEPPVIPCGSCGKPATEVCASCVYSAEGWLCHECAARHECGGEMLLPIVNSPRTGICGYTG